eukprot:COSAG02_NODE_26286_length_636_cov_0.877095_1_plen_195_part_00
MPSSTNYLVCPSISHSMPSVTRGKRPFAPSHRWVPEDHGPRVAGRECGVALDREIDEYSQQIEEAKEAKVQAIAAPRVAFGANDAKRGPSIQQRVFNASSMHLAQDMKRLDSRPFVSLHTSCTPSELTRRVAHPDGCKLYCFFLLPPLSGRSDTRREENASENASSENLATDFRPLQTKADGFSRTTVTTGLRT